MNWALVLVLACGSVLVAGDYGLKKTESEEDDLVAELEKEFLILKDDPPVTEDKHTDFPTTDPTADPTAEPTTDPTEVPKEEITCGDNTCEPFQICDKDSNTCRCPDGKTGDDCEDDVCPEDLKKHCEDIGAKCIQDPADKNDGTCNCTTPNTKFDGKKCSELCGKKVCQHFEICDKDVKTCRCPDGKTGVSCEDPVCSVELEEFCKTIGAACKQDPVNKNNGTCECTDQQKKFDGKKCEDCTCGKEGAGNCKFVNGEKVCDCNSGYSLKDTDKLCYACTCGKEGAGICKFENGEKVCQCNSGYSKNDTDKMCSECTCGEDSAANCKIESGKKICECSKGYSLKDIDKLCYECTCGEEGAGNCKFEAKEKVCDCNPGYSKNGTDTLCYECTCGVEGAGNCTFENGEKVCDCNSGYSKNGTDTLCYECTCGKEGAGNCKFENGEKVCQCNSGYSKNDTDQLCYECSCGETGAGNCKFVGKEKVCNCNAGFSLKQTDKMCYACDCGDGTCTFDENGNKKCTCKAKYAEKNGKCEPCDCGSGGTCSFENDGSKKCSCNDKYAEKNGKCEVCDCGDGTCSFDANGIKKCSCKDKFADKNGKCEKCDCGEGTCSFNNGIKKCVCNDKYAVKNGMCEECDCGSGGTCSFKEEKGDKVCKCKPGFALKDKTCEDCNCGVGGTCSFKKDGSKNCLCKSGYSLKNGNCEVCECGSGGKCSFKEDDGSKVCQCKSGYALKEDMCAAKCGADSDCKFGKKCEQYSDKDYKFCNCGDDLSGDKCEKVKECETGIYKQCKPPLGTCTYKENKAQCICDSSKKLDLVLNYCRKKCTDKGFCKNEATCENELCKCPPGTSGDDCSVADGCTNDFKKKCEEAKTTCVYDKVSTNNARCKCSDDENFEFDDTEKKCSPRWCKNNPCSSTSECKFADGAQRCECKNKAEYYDYVENKCIDINKCPIKKCENGTVCKNGNCECEENYEEVDGNCKPKDMCSTSPCYSGANCTKGSVQGSVKCECHKSSFYNPSTDECEDGKCFLPGDNRKECEECPGDELERNKENGKCEAKVAEEKCGKDCGKFGYCLKKDGKDTCVCIENFAMNEAETCILNAENICASKKVLDNDKTKCNCSGMYKYSTNGITCELKTCGDDDAQSDCKSKGAYCVDKEDSSSKRNGYKCDCPPGFSMSQGRCIDACLKEETIELCSKQQKVCYINKNGEGECKCPPGYTEKIDSQDSTKKTCEPNAEYEYLIQSLPVKIDEYQQKDSLNKVKLISDIIESMKTIYKDLEYCSLQQYKTSEDGKVILCDVWLQFRDNASKTIQRWKTEAVKKDSSLILPPALYLSENRLDKVKSEELNFCSEIVKLAACGQGTKCKDNKCSCDSGYRVIGPTVQELGGKVIRRCADIDECQEKTHKCDENSKCVNTQGSYFCRCQPGFYQKEPETQETCVGLCTPNPCSNGGECKLTDDKKVDCRCKVGFQGSYCTAQDAALKSARHSTTVVGAVLGTLLALTFVAIVVYIVRQRKNSYSEDFAPAPRENAEMVERSRPMRGVSNRAYQ